MGEELHMDKMDATVPGVEEIEDRIEELQQRAMKDALSGLLNRGALEQCVNDRLRGGYLRPFYCRPGRF